jgi:hypothetical protein
VQSLFSILRAVGSQLAAAIAAVASTCLTYPKPRMCGNVCTVLGMVIPKGHRNYCVSAFRVLGNKVVLLQALKLAGGVSLEPLKTHGPDTGI